MRYKITLLSIIILLGSIMLAYLVYKSNQKRINSVILVQHTIEVSYQTAKIGVVETQIKTLLLSYKNTQDTSLLEPIATAQRKMSAEIDQLIYLTRDNHLQHQRAQLLKRFSKTTVHSSMTSDVAHTLDLIQQEESRLLKIRKTLYVKNLNDFNWFNLIIFSCLLLFGFLLLIAIRKINFQLKEKDRRANELDVANKTLFFESKQKKKRAYELILAKRELFFQKGEKGKRAEELRIADKERLYQSDEKEKRAAELVIANKELSFQNDEKEKRAQELSIANTELSFQNNEKEQRAAELALANIELSFQSSEKEKRAAELVIANKELSFQNDEKEKRAQELSIANTELSFQNNEKEQRAAELALANIELSFQSSEKEKRAAELVIANKELSFQNDEKEKRAQELSIANTELSFQNNEKEQRAAELALANIELSFQSSEKEKRAQELSVANVELSFQNNEKEQRAAELALANIELSFQSSEKEKRAQELSVANEELSFQNNEKEQRALELKKTVLQLNKSESSLREAQAISHIGNFEIDLVHHTEVWSDGMFTILGLEKAFSTPSINYFLKYIHPEDVSMIRVAIKNSFATHTPTKLDFRFYRSDGTLRYGYTEAQFELVNSTPIRLFGIFQDITENKLAELERNKMVKELIQRNKDLEQFAYIISHNLRAPVANILGASEILKDNNNSKADETILKNGINESVLKLDGVIKDLNHILDVKTSTNQQQEIVNFKDLVADIKNSIAQFIEQNDISITCDFKEVQDLSTLKPYLYSIFYNLITNSIKYRKPNRPVKINISSRKTLTGVELSFADNGLGINLQKDGEQLFGLYKRFHVHVEGKGMGLFMVKTQVEALDGHIEVLSNPKGTTFKITF